MKGLTILQPYTSLIACGSKRFETRRRRTNYRGKLAIHAGKRQLYPEDFDTETRENILAKLPDKLRWRADKRNNMPTGAIIAVADIIQCYDITRDIDRAHLCVTGTADMNNTASVVGDEFLFGEYLNGWCAWELANITPLKKPIIYNGRQGIWNVPAEIEQLILAQIPTDSVDITFAPHCNDELSSSLQCERL